MANAGLAPDAVVTLDAFRARFPLSTKSSFLADQTAHAPFGERLCIPRQEVALVNMTGGTSGQGQEIYGRSQRDVHMQGYLHALPWFLAGLRSGDIAINCVPAGGLTTGGWGPGEGLRIVGATAFHVGGTLSTDAKIDLMQRIGEVNFIYASTNYLHTLTEALLRRGLEPKRAFPTLRTLFIAAEGYRIEWAERIEALWGCRLQEGYGSTQCAGFGASTCGDGVMSPSGGRGLMRLFEWETLFEVARSGNAGPLLQARPANSLSPTCRSKGLRSFASAPATRALHLHRDTGSGPRLGRDRVRHDRPVRRHAQDPRQQCLAFSHRLRRLRLSRGRRVCRPRLHQRGRQDRDRGSRRPGRPCRPSTLRPGRDCSTPCARASRSAPISG